VIGSLLIANRGEIACRIIRTARRLGVRTIAVYSDADAKALHVREADEAVHIGASPARESYLVGEKIIAAARETCAEAIHPGYGFLSENADFAQDVIDAGLIWVGPRPDSIRAMGLKDAAKKLMDAAGVPTTPGYLGEDQDPGRLASEAETVGFPILIKAVAGGGGKGMRRVNDAAEFQEMLQSCKREAASSFGDDRVLIEKYVERPRHIEVQVFGDTHGNVVHLFERDCSLQRRHQKVIEEAPAPGMDEATRAAVCGAAVKAAKAVNYVGAGTIEFIADASEGLRADRIWFMEMNTRLQVEHPVTEEITGQDLVEWQLRVASGEPLPLRQEELAINGWAMEARLYAEDPATGFLPSTGKLSVLRFPHDIRIETGVQQGDEVSPFYDPMIAKLVVSAPNREEAISALAEACGEVQCAPVRTNAWFLHRLILEPEFRSGEMTTAFIPAHGDRLAERPVPSDALLSAAAEKAIWQHVPFEQTDIMRGLAGFRLNADRVDTVTLSVDGQPVAVQADLRSYNDFWDGPGGWISGHPPVFFESGAAFLVEALRFATDDGGHEANGSLISPMPGRVIAIDARQGEKVTKGQKLLTLEAMKMEHSLTAPFDGTLAEMNASEGAQVTEGTLLARVEKAIEGA